MEDVSGSFRFDDNKDSDWRNNPGRSANTYHANFSKELGYSTMEDIRKARDLGAILDTNGKGFHSRNLQIAKSKRMLAFSWSKTGEPDSGGTLHTWQHCSGQKIHINLADLKESPSPASETK